MRRDGRWQYVPREDPSLKYLLEKQLITQEEYDRGLQIIEERRKLFLPTYTINYGQGLNLKVEEQFFLKIRGAMQFRFNSNSYNDAWRTTNDPNTGHQRREDSSAATLSPQIMRLQFLGYAFDPDFRYDFTIGADRPEGSPTATGGMKLVNAYVASWHIPYANLVVGQYKVWFNRAQIQSVMNLSFVTRMAVQNAFMANGINRRDIGFTLLSGENKYRLNYAVGVFNGSGITLDRLSTTGVARNANELMYVGRILWKVSGNPLYGEDDVLYSQTPQVAIAVGAANNPAVNFSDPVPAVENQIAGVSGNRRLLGAGIVDLTTFGLDVIARYQGWSLQAEYYYRLQNARRGNPALGNATGWYAMLGYYLVPRKLEIAGRYGLFDPNTRQGKDLVEEFGVALNYSLDGTYDHRIVTDFTTIRTGTGGSAGRDLTSSNESLVNQSLRVLYQFYW